jgi:hypothetical protein
MKSPVTPIQKRPIKPAVSPMKKEMDQVVRNVMSRVVENTMSPIAVEIIDTVNPNELPDTIILKFNSEEAIREFLKVRASSLSVLATIQNNEAESKSLTLCLKSQIIEQGVTVDQITLILQKIFGDDIRPIKTPFKPKQAKNAVLSPIVTPNIQYRIKNIVCEKEQVTINFMKKLDQDAFYKKYRSSGNGDMRFFLGSTSRDTCVHIVAARKGINGNTITKWLEQEFGKTAIDDVRAKKNFTSS